MKTSTQYHDFAEDCLRLAKTVKTEDERKILQEIAAKWQKLAAGAEQQNSNT
jgi:hypothetical protein